MKRRNGIEVVVLALSALTLGACSGSPEKDYRALYADQVETESKQQSLEVPPKLNLPRTGQEMQIPGIGREQASYSGMQGNAGKETDSVVASAEDVRFVRQGNMHWLEVNLPPEQVWDAAGEFMENLGFEITERDRKLGLLETNWQERRERVPGNWLERMIDAIGSSGFKDRYRLRLERGDNGGTRVFITHRGMKEIVVDGGGIEVVETAWVPNDTDHDLEVELLQRFLISLGGDEEQASRMVATAEPEERTEFRQGQDTLLLQVNETFPRTWRRVGLALDRVGLLVEDRNRSEGAYYIKLTEEFMKQEKQGFWASLMESEDQKAAIEALLLRVRERGDYTEISLRDRDNQKIDPELSKRLLEEIEVHLR
ncbi:outer membrane protein assembly factor BamC [Thiohalophilus thiocyanatoxydans]|uniref:Beta-barrel assembly machine subunit BamC n=1 Tax=Thiohalophilus thiocyanatoxydans TaxID=381308 RepID=A0A4R8IL90_9GAMM|nr:outer membrane protein assembly factor BamC [Thiohalophilus thiocyanatoxydans]TDY01546.1 Beta-barrel assembly machine subunit BamC [Thiohalophilus thiocyanatoxydans]